MLDLILRIPTDLVLASLLLVPGLLVARLARPLPTPLQAVSETLLCGTVVVAVPAFSVALVTRSFVRPWHLLVWALLICLPAPIQHEQRRQAASGALRLRFATSR